MIFFFFMMTVMNAEAVKTVQAEWGRADAVSVAGATPEQQNDKLFALDQLISAKPLRTKDEYAALNRVARQCERIMLRYADLTGSQGTYTQEGPEIYSIELTTPAVHDEAKGVSIYVQTQSRGSEKERYRSVSLHVDHPTEGFTEHLSFERDSGVDEAEKLRNYKYPVVSFTGEGASGVVESYLFKTRAEIEENEEYDLDDPDTVVPVLKGMIDLWKENPQVVELT